MEDEDKVSSTAPDNSLEIAVNEAAAVGQIQTDAEEERADKTSSLQTTEVTSPLQTTEKTSPPQTTEVTSPPETTEVTSPPETTEVTSPPQTTEITSSSQMTEKASPPQTTEVTSPLQMTEVTGSPQTTAETSSLQTPEVTSSSQMTEKTCPPQTAQITSPLQMTNVTSPPQRTEETSSPQTAEVTSPLQMTEITSPPQTAEVTSSSQTAEETSPPQTAQERAFPVSEAPRTSTRTEPEAASCTPAAPGITDARVTPVKPAESASAPPAPAPAPTPAPEASRDPLPDAREEQERPPSDEPEPFAAPAVAPVLFQPQFPSDRWDSPSIASQAATHLNMDSLGHKDSAGFEPDVLSQSDDDFMFEMKKSPFQAFSPLNDGLGETPAARKSVEASDSPSPDLVQDAYDGDEGHVQAEMRDLKQELTLSYASDVNTPSEDRPTSLPDILKSSPMNPEKVDSGSSEGSPEFSPVHRSANDSPNSPFSLSANNLLGLDSKILLLKEMAEVTEARIAEKAKLEEAINSEPSLVAFDLVKETDTPPKSDNLFKDKFGGEMLSQTSIKMAHKFECLNFPSGKAQEHWDSESPSAESFSPVLDAVTHKPSSFTVEQEQRAADEASEPEPLSEEFEFVERPPRGTADEFLEMQDSMTFTKPPSEVLLNEDRTPELEAADSVPEAEEARNQSSYLPHTQAAVRGKADLESDFQEISPTPVIHLPVDKTSAGKQEDEGTGDQMPDLSTATVLDLLYWRDVRSSALVFGSSLFVLLSLVYCSIISVLSYAALALLSITLSFRIYKGVLQAIQKSDEGHPFKWFLEKDIALSSEVVQRHSDVALSRINGALKELRRLFLVEDLVDSLKFAVLLWVFTYVGSWFNGLTILILSLVGAFIGPITYENHQAQIDNLISMVKSQVKDVLGKIQAKVPGAKIKPE